ncbi:MAG: rumA [Gammaproteobacteria bacterium]|nr:MAG: rumA [Gammaproteobacteria bacterium]TND07014.1 MAG: rumA [Gammaproteobacteria bacterium]
MGSRQTGLDHLRMPVTAARSRKRPLPEPVVTEVRSLAHDGRGVAQVDGKTLFIDGALPGEQVLVEYRARSRRYDEGRVVEIVRASVDRVVPGCEYFERCGGCSLQHLSSQGQVAHKQQTLLDNLDRIGHVIPDQVLAPITGPAWGYRRKARLGVRFVRKKNALLVGFREKRNSFITEIERCPVLDPRIGERIVELRELVASLKAYDQVAQLEVAVADNAAAIVVRHLVALDAADTAKLVEFGKQHQFHIYLQSGGVDTIKPLWPEDSSLVYRLEEYGLAMRFEPSDFTQVNADINHRMIARAVELLAPGAHEHVLDLFCGIGNFSLPLARTTGRVTGVEGDARLVQKARDNARENEITNAGFLTENLAVDGVMKRFQGLSPDKVLLDPPRSGAWEVVSGMSAISPSRIVYVSCDTATLARDAGELVANQGYRLISAGVMDMFPHTSHVESMALFERR